MKNTPLICVALLAIFVACNNNTETTESKDGAGSQAASSPAPIADSMKLNGTWKLTRLTGVDENLDSLHGNRTPYLLFDVTTRKLSGNTGCNNFSGELDIIGAKISFAKPMAMTKMFCEGNLEPKFLGNLEKVTSYRVVNDTALSFMADEIEIMRFAKQ